MMTPALLLLFNHTLTEIQTADARRTLGVQAIIALPEDLRRIWCQIPADQPSIYGHLAPLREWVSLTARTDDFILIQGDFGATWLMVQFAMQHGLVPVYATTRREATETRLPDGTTQITHHFRHVMFRRYV